MTLTRTRRMGYSKEIFENIFDYSRLNTFPFLFICNFDVDSII